ncbi:hypothetical protein [Shewanella algae]|uniref:hypothetical protein n=1 Tax=Shewanella algae TaxID=38313 RepID=UPI0031F49137
MDDFDSNVFVNCPFDDDYRQLLLSVIFAVKTLGFNPRLSLERNDSGETRIDKILNLIRESKFGIHDLSRIISSGSEEHYRMNMPFELGIDYGCQKLNGDVWSRKKILILEKERYRYQKALSDLSGSDIKNHDDDPMKVIKVVRNWFVPSEIVRAPSGNVIWNDFNDFQAFLHDELVSKDGHESVDEVEIIEVISMMDSWFEMKCNKSSQQDLASEAAA